MAATAKIAAFPMARPRRSTRGLKARSTRFANDVERFCIWYFTGTNRSKRTKVNEEVEWLAERAKQQLRRR